MQQKSAQFRSSYAQLRRELMHGQLTPGSRLVEEKWSTLLGVNRSAIRQTLLILAHEGLLTVGSSGGYFVPVFDQIAYDESLEVRLSLEIGALQTIEINGGIPAESLERLRSACELMRRQMESSLEYGFAEADRKFHDILVESAGNQKLLKVYLQSPLPIRPCRDADPVVQRDDMERTIREHLELCDLLEQTQIAAATDRLRSHLLRTHSGPRTLVPLNQTSPAKARLPVEEQQEQPPVSKIRSAVSSARRAARGMGEGSPSPFH